VEEQPERARRKICPSMPVGSSRHAWGVWKAFGKSLDILLGGVNSACHWNMEIKSDRGIIWMIGVNGNGHKSSCGRFHSVAMS
jgi:hypothetical protein